MTTAELRQAEDSSTAAQERLAAMSDYLDVCVEIGLPPRELWSAIKGRDRHDEIAIDSAIRDGIHRFNPALDNYACLFVRHFYRPVQLYAEAAE